MKKIKPSFANAAAPGALVQFSNAISIGDDGWMMLAPYGDHPSQALIPDGKGKMKKQKAIQRINKANAEKMVATFHNSRVGLKKFVVGTNIYLGHPDVPGLEKFYPDKSPKGLYSDMEAREDALYGKPVFNNEGEGLITSKAVRSVSGYFGESESEGDVNGVPVYSPTKIYSAGLTNNPHLPVHFFNADDTLADADAEADKTKTKNTMKKKLIAVCAVLGIQFANEAADDAQTEAALDQVQAKVTAFANEATAATAKNKTIREKLVALCAKVGITFANEAAITDPAATIAQIEEKVTKLDSDLTAARTQFANERTDRIKDELALGISSGRITDAEKPTWDARLKVEAQFANEVSAIRGLAPKVKTKSITLTRGGREEQVDVSDANTRRRFVNEVLSEIATEGKLDPVKDARKIQNLAHQRHPALFDNVPHVEIKMPGSKK